MSTIQAMAPHLDELIAVRRDLHANPELGLEVPRTAGIVSERLRAWGFEVETGVGGHGVVGTIRGNGGESRRIGLRADMDALPIEEAVDVPWRSSRDGLMHACGHDGHTVMLLGACRHLAEARRFEGIVHAIFQPGEEGAGGALAMLADGLFERFPCEAIYALHNRPGQALGTFTIAPGPFMAGGAFFDLRVVGRGGHAATPEAGVDPIFVAAQIVSALQGVVARSLSPLEPAVLSITRIHGGEAYNVVPDTVDLGGTVRWLVPDSLPRIEALFRRTVERVAAALGGSAEIDWRVPFTPLVNDPHHTTVIVDAATDLVGATGVKRDAQPSMIAEDFAFMMEHVPGAYVHLGIGEGSALHTPTYAFNDAAIPYGAALFARIIEGPR